MIVHQQFAIAVVDEPARRIKRAAQQRITIGQLAIVVYDLQIEQLQHKNNEDNEDENAYGKLPMTVRIVYHLRFGVNICKQNISAIVANALHNVRNNTMPICANATASSINKTK